MDRGEIAGSDDTEGYANFTQWGQGALGERNRWIVIWTSKHMTLSVVYFFLRVFWACFGAEEKIAQKTYIKTTNNNNEQTNERTNERKKVSSVDLVEDRSKAEGSLCDRFFLSWILLKPLCSK